MLCVNDNLSFLANEEILNSVVFICHYFLFCRIQSEAFVALRDQIIELFPTEDGELLFVPYSTTPTGTQLSARGCLYNEYKFVRNQLRQAGLLKDDLQEDIDEGTYTNY